MITNQFGTFNEHRLRNSRAYFAWNNMKNRCLNRNHPSFKDYGGRGINISKVWLNFESFVKDMGQPGEDQTLERLNNSLGYSKDNCVWAERSDQVFNRRGYGKSKLKGAVKHKDKWKSSIRIDNKTYHIGVFKTEYQAHLAFKTVFKEFYGYEPRN